VAYAELLSTPDSLHGKRNPSRECVGHDKGEVTALLLPHLAQFEPCINQGLACGKKQRLPTTCEQRALGPQACPGLTYWGQDQVGSFLSPPASAKAKVDWKLPCTCGVRIRGNKRN
jgi:hypothetical protein